MAGTAKPAMMAIVAMTNVISTSVRPVVLRARRFMGSDLSLGFYLALRTLLLMSSSVPNFRSGPAEINSEKVSPLPSAYSYT